MVDQIGGGKVDLTNQFRAGSPAPGPGPLTDWVPVYRGVTRVCWAESLVMAKRIADALNSQLARTAGTFPGWSR